MPEEKDKIKKLYDTFVSDGYDMESEEDFRKNLLDSTKRKAAYDALVKDGYDMEPFEEFESNIGFGKERTSSQQSGNSDSGTVEEPISPANEQTWQPTEKEKVAMLTETDRIMNDVKSHTQTFNERIDNMQEYGINPGLQTKEGKMIFNPESGKLEKTFLTPAGNRYYSKSLADMESFQYRQAADMSIGGQLRKANLRLQELKAKQAERASEVHKEWAEETENNKAPLAAILGAATYTPRQQSDKENRALSVAIRQTEELIKDLEEQKDRENGVDVGFWRGFGRTMGDVRTWDFGMGDMRDAFTMMNADELKKENATEGERETHDAMMGAIHEKQQAEERYSGNADFWNRAGVMTGYMPSFMLDFVLTGGGFNGLSSFSKGSTRLATKVISKETAEKMAQQGFKSYIKENGAKGLGRYATDWTIKALGTTADDLLVRAPLMANTVQAGKTTADIIDRKLGDVVVDENGNYDFSNDKTWGDAIWQSEANAIIENYSEMFGAHLDPVFTLGNMSKLANVVGAKRIGAVLSKADASALNGIMGQTHQMFNKMGVSDYVGEVSEEYYGQLWRTMLNLDDAYQQNPDGTRTNLFASGQFHGDIWGGMALSMGLMGAGKHTLSAANYTSMKHGVNKADAKVNELLGKEVWEPLKATLDLTTNENIGEVAELIAGDKDFTINEKAAVLDYMERSLNLRGFNLASMAQSRGGNRNESVQQANDSYLDGYNIISSQEMNDAKNMYEYQRARVADLVDESMFAMIEENPIAALEFVNGNEQWNDEDKVSVIDYINAKQVYNGMIQRVRDDIDGRIEQSNSMIDARVNHNTGMIQGATMKQDERKVYVISGKLVPYDDGSGVSVTDSDNSIIIRDSETGALEQVSPDAVLSLDESQDPNEQKELAEQAIVEQFAREAADKIDGKVTFNSGDAYTITGQDGSRMQVQVIANEDGIVDNGDGTVNVSDGVNIFPLAKETIQQQADAANLARVAQFEQQRTIENAERKQEMQEAERPQYALNDIVSLTDENGVTVRGNITADADADGKYEVFTEAPINGKRVNLFTRDELDNMLLEHNGVAFEHPAENESNNGAENIPENDNNAPQNIPAMQRIPKDEQGNPLYEQADSDTAWDAIVEQTEGDEDMAQTVADGMVADKEEALKKLEKVKSKGGNSIAEKIASEKERKAAIDAAKQELLVWQKIAGTAKRRKMEADDERRRISDEAAALRKAEEEKLRAEREEAERIEREALNGVPDMVDDKPQDARARGYKRMNGHKIDRQEPVQALQGKEVSVKFSDDAIVGGRVAVIDANLLQPSHIQGVRNPLHFIDEAQPKERNDEASVLSARKIAGNIRPEEITSSVTAYTGAPTVNARGEAIQGNNRSDALRIMWENHPEQAALYKQYLKDHAEEFGLQAEDIEAMEHPVLVNMVDVDDAEAIRLGQYVAQDTESGGVERIKPKNALQRMGAEMRSFANLLLRTSDDEMSFAGLVDSNGANVLKWMSQRGFITPTQYKSAFDSKGNLTPESKNDLRGIMYQSIFKDGSTRLEEMFNVLPVKAQKAILATAFRDYDSPNSERMVDEIQNSVRAYYALSQDKMFAEAKNFKEARTAIESWKRQYQMDDVTGESYLPADNFSNFVLHLAAMYKGESQSFIQNTFGKIYDLIQGTQEETLFEQPDNTPRTLVQAIKEALNLDYNGQQRSNVLVGDTATSQRGQQGSNGTLAPRERVENRNGTTDDTGRTESIGGQSEIESSLSQEEMLFSDDTDNQLSAKIARRIEVQEDDWIESGKYGDTYKQTIIVDGTHKVIKVDAPDTKGNYIGSAYEYDGQTFGDLLDVLNYIDTSLSLANAVAVAEKETDTTPTEKQKEAGNYKKGHVQVGTFNITIENPKGSVRSGIDTEGNKWETIMQNTYGYIRGTEGVDGDHIDVFLSDDIDGWNGRRVFVVDQYNEDGSFDEHKVMLGFNETDDAEAAYFANYDSDWANNHKTVVTAVNLEDFEKWIDSSHRKTKAFAEYKSVKSVEEQSSGTQVDRLSEIKSRIEELHKEQEAAHGQSDIFEEARIISEINDLFAEQRKLEQSNSNEETTTPTDAAYTITPAQYTTKRGKVLDMHLVEFNNELRDTVRKHTTMFAKQLKGWWDKEKQGFMMRSKEDAERLAEYATDAQSQPPLSLSDLSEVNDGNVQFSEPQQQKATKQEEKQEYTPIWQYSVFVDKETGETTLSRDDVSGPIPIGDARFRQTTNSPEEMLDILRNPQNGMQEVLDAVGISLENKIKTRELDRKAKDEIRDKRTDFVVDKEMDNRYSVRTLMKMIDAEKQAVMDLGEKRGGDVYHEGNIIFLTKDSADKFANEVRTLINDMRSEQQQDNSQKKTEASGNRLVTDERYAELRERMRKKLLGQMNIGIDPEILAIGTEMAVYHLEKGSRKFAEYATAMIADLGDAIRPYLKAFYNGARDLPEVAENGLDADMTPYDEVQQFDVANFDKKSIDALATAETVTRETEVEQEAEIAQERIKKSRPARKKNEKKAVNSRNQTGGLFGDLLTENDKADAELHRQFAMTVKADMLAALDNGTKPYRSILDLRKRASELGMEVDNDGRTDILLQELVEDGLVRAAREVIERKGSASRESYDLICKLYEMQPTISARSSNRIKMQQYSTPLPMAWIADRFAMADKADGSVLEPTAGNGMLVFTIPVGQVHVNELDETRLDNLREQGFAQVTQQDATEPFDGDVRYDVVIANPPFGKREAVEYDGKKIPGLDPQITLNALSSMKDDGRAAIIIGGNMEYANNGAIKSMKPFFTYLYDHYNVKGVIDMGGGLYAKQGTTFPTRMILIDGRRTNEERAQTAVYPPVENKAIRKAESFDDLYEIINEVLNFNEKTNGTEVLRSQGGRHLSVADNASGETDGAGHNRQSEADDESGSQTERRGRTGLEGNSESGQRPVLGKRGQNDTVGETGRGTDTIGKPSTDGRGLEQRTVGNEPQPVDGVDVQRSGLELKGKPKKRDLTEEKLPYRPHNTAFRLESVAPAAMVEAMDKVLSQIEAQHGSIDEFVKTELGYDTIAETYQALAAEQMDSVAMAIYQMKQEQALIIGDQTGVGKGRQMAALIRWAVQRGEKPVFITQKADLFSDIYRDLVDVGSGDLVPFIFNSDGAMVDSKGNTVHKPLSSAEMAKVFASGALPEEYDFAVLTYSQVNTGDAVSQQEMEEAAKKSGARTKKSKNVKNGKATPKATFLRAIAKDNYLFLDESHTAAGSSNTGAYLQSILRGAKAATFASATFAKRPDTMPLYAIRTAMSQAKVDPDKMISIIEKGGVTLQEIMSRELTNAGQMVRRERDMSDVVTDWKTITDPETVRRARENYDRTIAAFNAIIKFQEDYVKPMIEALDMELAVMAESAGVKRGTDKMGVENVPFASKTYNYTKQLMLALKVDAIADEVEAEINAGRHPVIALESTMESSIKDYTAGETIDEPTFSASLLKGLDTVMQYTVKDEDGNERHERYSPQALGPAGEKAYYELQDFIRESTCDIFISPLDAIIERLNDKGYKVGELTGRNMYVERNDDGRVVVKRRTDKDKKKMQREFNSGALDVLILNKSASTGISLHASEKFSDQRQRSMIIAQPLSDINDYMQMIGRIDRTGQVHRGYYINLGLPVPAENRFLMMLSTKLKSLNANTTTSQDSESNDVEAPDLLNKYGSQVVVEYLRDNVEIYEKMGAPLKKGGLGGGRVQASELDEYKPQEDDARKITGYVALLTTKEQEEFYDDVVRRYNELIKYLNDTGSNDLKITVMPLRAKTIEKRVSSEGIDPDGNNPFARNSFVEKVEMDVLRKPMKADEIRKVIEQINRGSSPADYLESVLKTIRNEDEARIAAEEERYEKAKAKAVDDIAKQTDKINGQKKRSDEEKRVAIENFIAETNEKVENKHNDNIVRLNQSSGQIMRRLRMFEVGKSYLVPDNLEAMVFDFATPAIFCGYKTKDSKITASTTLAVFATLDGRRRIEIKLSQIDALRSIDKMTNDNWDAARATTLDNWDSQIPSETRKTGFIMTGNILQAIADTQDEYGGYPGQLISYTDIDGNVHDGILMPDKWNASMLKTSGAPLSSRLQQIKDYTPITSHDGKVEIMGSSWAKMFYLTVPKTKKDGALYYENKTLLRAAGGNFYPYRGKLRADIPEERIIEVVKELTKLGVKVKEERTDDDTLYRSDDTMYRIREDAAPQNTGIGYKVFVLKNGELYPPMVANPNGEATPVGVWLDADAAPIAGQSKTGRNQVKAGGKGTQGGNGKLAYRPGWHLGVIPYALQFNRIDENGDKTLFPANFVWAEVEYANDVDYQEEAMSYGYNKNGKFQHSYAGLPRIPENGAYTYRTNPNPETDPWIITGAMRVKRLLTPSEVDEMVKAAGREPQRRQENAVTDAEISALNAEIANDYRNGIGTYTDDEVSYENDPVAKLLSQSRRTAKQRREFARRERQRMAERVESLAEKLHLDNVEVVTDASVLDGKKQRAKGFYSKSTGKITIVIPNHTSTFDVEQTLLHEAVAHYGLRQLFGEHFDTFLDNVFNNADENIRRRIVDMAAKNGWDFHKATEEYLASLAEDTEFENINASWWQQIKDFFLNMLHKIGFEDFRGVTLSDNELRYILWRSYENLAEPGRYRNILGEAADVAKQYELKVGNYAVSDPHHLTVAESDDVLYRTGDPEIHERELARDRYERRVKSGMFQSREALQDSMLGLKEAMTAILGKETNIEDVDGFENAYLGENRLSSVNKAEADAFAHTLFKPMLDEVAKLARTEAEREELTDYMMAKHGLERNTYMRNEAINNGATDADQTDYAGLTALTGMDNITDAETEAQIMVNDYEQAHDTTDLWKKVNAASKAILSKSYECGMMSKATFDKISDMYDFYIPLRGFDEKTSSEAYAYLTHKQSAFNAPIKKAEGRRSKADDPFANLQSMAEGAIMQGNRNKLVKQRFLNFALNHSSDLVSVSDIWVEYDTVADEWKPVFPDNIDSTDTPEVVERKMLDFETKMESLAQQYPDRYKHGKDTVNIPYRIVESRDMRQHQIVVKRGGRDYVITINGNPRAAQALNGQTNPDNDMSGAIGAILRAGENINRQLSAFYTTRNPDFIVSNFMRDMLYTNTMTWIRESPNYALRFHRNYMYANPVRIKQLLAKHRKGTLDMSNKTEAMFHQFMMNGGETGYANIRDIEQHKNDIRRELKKSNGKIPVKKAWDLLGERFDEYNRAVENCARFAAFMTSREMGRSIDRAIYDAKEISVNFNKKGSGAKFYDSTGQTKAGNASALVSGLGRSGYVFWNAAIQGTANFGRQMKRHPAKAFTGIAAMFLLGAIVAYLGGDDDDDDDKNAYYNLPEYVRRSNILFRAGNSWVSIPLPVEYRAVYGMGELMISVLNGKEHLTGEEIAEAITGQATQILPIDFLEGGGGLNAFVPSAYKPLWEAYVAEKSWTGMPLYKDTPYNKDMPEWTKAYKSANKYIVGLANAMNEATGGDPYTKGTIDFNPAKIEYMLNGYFGGVFGTIDKLSKTAETITDNREYDPRSFLLVNRLVKAGDERTEYRAVNNEYFRLKEEHDRLKSRLKHYEEDTDNDIFDYAEKIDFLYNSPEYERYEIFEDYHRDIDDLYNELNDTVDDEERKNIEAELNELKKEMIEEMNKTRK